VYVTPNEIVELDISKYGGTSGLIYMDGSVWSKNDGSVGAIRAIDTISGGATKQILMHIGDGSTYYSGYDTEDMTDDDDYIYVGDFGNNRYSTPATTFKILRIKKSDILKSGDSYVKAEVISYSYSDQGDNEDSDYGNDPNNNPYFDDERIDCEAMIAFKGKIYLFSKNWNNRKTRFYELEATPGTHIAKYRATLDIKGLVTAATINPYTKILNLSVFRDGRGEHVIFYDYTDDNFFDGSSKRLKVQLFKYRRVEAIAYFDLYSIYATNEAFQTYKPYLYSLDLAPYVTTYDDIAGALEIPHKSGVVLEDINVSTVGMSGDKQKGSCWKMDPQRNVWFKFKAASDTVSVTMRNGNGWGDSKKLSMALWEDDGTTEVDCKSYNSSEDDIFIHNNDLIKDNWYYISVDSEIAGGFTLFLDNNPLLIYEKSGDDLTPLGSLRFNTDTTKFEYYNGTNWVNMHK
jgi:hypothetical protein